MQVGALRSEIEGIEGKVSGGFQSYEQIQMGMKRENS